MSKKHKHFNQASFAHNPSTGDHAEEYRVIKMDLVKVAIVNAIFLAAVLALHYTNLHSGYLEKLVSRYLKF